METSFIVNDIEDNIFNLNVIHVMDFIQGIFSDIVLTKHKLMPEGYDDYNIFKLSIIQTIMADPQITKVILHYFRSKISLNVLNLVNKSI